MHADPVQGDFGEMWDSLSERGFAISSGHAAHELLTIGRMFGAPVAEPRDGVLIKPLRPVASGDAPRNTLSAHYGQGPFPLHTEAAYWPVPPRFLILFCVAPGDGAQSTLLVDGSPLCREQSLTTTPWLVSSGFHPFLGTLVDTNNGEARIRFDGHCMRPLTIAGRRTAAIVKGFIESAEPYRQAWQTGDLLIIDNCRMLHGRGAPTGETTARLLLKLLVRDRQP